MKYQSSSPIPQKYIIRRRAQENSKYPEIGYETHNIEIKLEPNLAKDVLIHRKFNAAFSIIKGQSYPGDIYAYLYISLYFFVNADLYPEYTYLISYHRPVLSRGETIDSCCSEDADPVTVLEVCYHDHHHDDKLCN